ncbi:MAG TPA: hypothetical protein VGM54_14915 [Chthoniobacter sp.]|jgi:hypothetical protein
MPQPITLFRVFLAAPSDVADELIVVEGVLHDWNLQQGQALGIRVELVNWRTHTWPSAGRRPQASVNKQAFDACDLVIAIFWSRFGTPTGKADSGTEEEIRRGIKMNKPVLVYFSDRPAPKLKRVEHSRIEKFKRQFGQKAIYWVYSDIDSFEKELRNHLALTMHDLLKRRNVRDAK